MKQPFTPPKPDTIILNMMRSGEGLQPTPHDDRDFSLQGVFGSASVDEIPMDDWMVALPLEIKNQADTLPDGCTGYSLTSVSEDQEGVLLDPGFTFAMIKKVQGSWQTWGGDLRSGCKVACEIGFIEVGQNPMDFSQKSRDFIANWNNWPLSVLLPLALKHKKESFFKVDGPGDHFDNVRVALYTHRDDGDSVYTGCIWRPGWLHATGGAIPKKIMAGGTGHAVKVCGQKMINGEPHLVIQNSYGPGAGDKGYHYVSRGVFNREFTFNSYMFKDMPKEEAKEILRGKGLLIEPNQGALSRFSSWILSFFK